MHPLKRVQLPEGTQWEADYLIADCPFPHVGLGIADVRWREFHHAGRSVGEERLSRQELAHLRVQMPPSIDVRGELPDAQLLDKRPHLPLDCQVALGLVPALLHSMRAFPIVPTSLARLKRLRG